MNALACTHLRRPFVERRTACKSHHANEIRSKHSNASRVVVGGLGAELWLGRLGTNLQALAKIYEPS